MVQSPPSQTKNELDRVVTLTWTSRRRTPPEFERPAFWPGFGSLGILMNQKPRLDDDPERGAQKAG